MIVYVKVKPSSSKQKIESFGNNRFLIYLKNPPEDNKANIELINLLSKYFGVPHTHISIKNPTSNEKVVEVN